jgi:hypothetical protein
MNPRRVTIVAAVLGVGVVSILVVLNLTVRDHIEACWFQLTRKTETIEPYPAEIAEILEKEIRESPGVFEVLLNGDDRFVDLDGYLAVLAAYSGCSVIFGNVDNALPRTRHVVKDQTRLLRRALESQHFDVAPALQRRDLLQGVAEAVLEVLRANGLRVFEQRLPRKAYVVIRPNP